MEAYALGELSHGLGVLDHLILGRTSAGMVDNLVHVVEYSLRRLIQLRLKNGLRNAKDDHL